MNDMVLREGFRRSFPGIAEGIWRAQRVFESITSFEDIERVFLKGAGLSPNTYRSYLEAVRQFYGFTGGKHPFQVTAADIEAFYDSLLKRTDLNTAYLRIAGFKRFFAGVRTVRGGRRPRLTRRCGGCDRTLQRSDRRTWPS